MDYKRKQYSTVFELEPSQQTGMQEGTSRIRLLESIALARAALLARRGKLKQAEALLLPVVKRLPSETSALDLLAKVYAQQERMEEAQQVWLHALQIEPCNTHFLRALICCARSMNTQNSSDSS